jgi:acetylornithine deacetylase/succinyl-diaminopimelate desuccinylase-like protein
MTEGTVVRRRLSALAIAGVLASPALAQQSPADRQRQLEREIFEELIEVNTSDSAGRTPELTAKVAARLRAAGFPAADVTITGFEPRYQSLVARYRGRAGGKKPILLMAHLDVVDARREDWSFDPYTFQERDGFYYGRGTSDNKAGAAILIANFIRLRAEGFAPDRDLIVVLTADEETAGRSIKWLLDERRELVDAEYALNSDAGGGALSNRRPQSFHVQASEKMYLSFVLEVRNKGGHSSLPVPDNAIYRLSRGLARLAEFAFPVRLNEVSRGYFARTAETETGPVAADMRALVARSDSAAAVRLARESPFYNSVMRTTCVATQLFGGHAENALPQLASAIVNCRLLPDESPDAVQATLARVVADSGIVIRQAAPPTPSPASPLRPDVLEPIERLVARMWPGVPVIPEMSTGATDGLHVRNAGIPVYGVSAIFEDVADVRAHGRDERVGVKEFHDASRFWYEMLKTLTSGRPIS